MTEGDRPTAIVLVSHHLEEIPRGFDRVLLLADGRAAAAGPADEVLRSDVLTRTFGLDLEVTTVDGRWTARATDPRMNRRASGDERMGG